MKSQGIKFFSLNNYRSGTYSSKHVNLNGNSEESSGSSVHRKIFKTITRYEYTKHMTIIAILDDSSANDARCSRCGASGGDLTPGNLPMV